MPLDRGRKFRLISTGCLSALTLAAAAPRSAAAEEWTITVAPYIWGTGLSGQVGALPGVPPIDVDVGFDDILDNLDFSFMGLINANNGRWGVTGDLFYAKISASNTGLAPLWSQTDVRVEETILSLYGEYKISESPTHALWALGGARYWDISTDITLSPGIAAGRSGTVADSWVDPVIGLRGRAEIGPKTYVTGWLMAGGFGVGSDEMYDIFGGVGYQFTPTTSVVLGYRWMSVDRTDGAFVFDMDTSGPLIGLSMRF